MVFTNETATTIIDSGHTAWILVSMALVLLMMPGLAFLYAGLLHKRSAVTMIMQNFASVGVIFILWFLFVFSLCFGHTYSLVGSITTFGMFHNVNDMPLYYGEIGQVDLFNADRTIIAGTVVSDIPGLVFAGYQGMFAVITPALMTGAFVDRLRFGPYLFFISIWITIVYAPFCHWIWGGGFLGQWGVRDFAGGICVHVLSGFSALAAVHLLGPRSAIIPDPANIDDTPHSLPLVALGTGLLWFGWFGFNGGSALASTGGAAFAAVNSALAASTALTVWTGIEWLKHGKPTLAGLCIGVVTGLATITPCAGFIRPWAAFVVSILSAFACYFACEFAKKMKWDDTLGVWGVHGIGGGLGSVLLGFLADKDVGGVAASNELVGKQVVAVLSAALYSYVVTYALFYAMSKCMVLKPTPEEILDLDMAFHGERSYGKDTTTCRECQAGKVIMPNGCKHGHDEWMRREKKERDEDEESEGSDGSEGSKDSENRSETSSETRGRPYDIGDLLDGELVEDVEMANMNPSVAQPEESTPVACIKPNEFTYNSVLVAFANAGNVAMVEETFQEMKREGVKPNDYTYNVVIKAHENGGNVEMVVRTFNEMKRANIMDQEYNQDAPY